jgi:hypothetical protein
VRFGGLPLPNSGHGQRLSVTLLASHRASSGLPALDRHCRLPILYPNGSHMGHHTPDGCLNASRHAGPKGGPNGFPGLLPR